MQPAAVPAARRQQQHSTTLAEDCDHVPGTLSAVCGGCGVPNCCWSMRHMPTAGDCWPLPTAGECEEHAAAAGGSRERRPALTLCPSANIYSYTASFHTLAHGEHSTATVARGRDRPHRRVFVAISCPSLLTMT